MASEPSDTEIRAMYATALEQIATLTAENERRSYQVVGYQNMLKDAAVALATAKREAVEAFYDAAMARADRMRAANSPTKNNSAYAYRVAQAFEIELERIRQDKWGTPA
jgi:hypothetical protein